MQESHRPIQMLLFVATAAIVLAVVTGIAFAGWLGHGEAMFFSLVESGLAWCF